jgi:hypothetical protein
MPLKFQNLQSMNLVFTELSLILRKDSYEEREWLNHIHILDLFVSRVLLMCQMAHQNAINRRKIAQ